MQSNIKYSDISLDGSNPVNEQAVLVSVKNILSTRVGERIHNRKFGCKLEDYLFEPFSFTISKLIMSEIVYALAIWEPRVTITSKSEVEPDYDNRTYNVRLVMTIKGLQGVHTIVDKYKAHTQS